jgi:16S rRNA G527 N7-methylase RsmG
MKRLEKRIQFLRGFGEEIEQKKIFILCFREEKMDSTKLRFPKG